MDDRVLNQSRTEVQSLQPGWMCVSGLTFGACWLGFYAEFETSGRRMKLLRASPKASPSSAFCMIHLEEFSVSGCQVERGRGRARDAMLAKSTPSSTLCKTLVQGSDP